MPNLTLYSEGNHKCYKHSSNQSNRTLLYANLTYKCYYLYLSHFQFLLLMWKHLHAFKLGVKRVMKMSPGRAECRNVFTSQNGPHTPQNILLWTKHILFGNIEFTQHFSSHMLQEEITKDRTRSLHHYIEDVSVFWECDTHMMWTLRNPCDKIKTSLKVKKNLMLTLCKLLWIKASAK